MFIASAPDLFEKISLATSLIFLVCIQIKTRLFVQVKISSSSWIYPSASVYTCFIAIFIFISPFLSSVLLLFHITVDIHFEEFCIELRTHRVYERIIYALFCTLTAYDRFNTYHISLQEN